MIAQNREQPRRHICAWLKRINVRKRAQKGLLHEVVGAVGISAQ
jgi:hypothetical protein